jgi:transposase-like protein
VTDRRTLGDDTRVEAPAECPFCRSRTLSTAAGRPRASNYWRCDTCGQLWNPERLRQTAPLDYRRR